MALVLFVAVVIAAAALKLDHSLVLPRGHANAQSKGADSQRYNTRMYMVSGLICSPYIIDF